MSSWEKIKLGEILTESKIESKSSSSDQRIRVLLNANGVIKRPLMKETKGATKYFERKTGQFIYGKQNLHKGAFGIIPEELDGFSSSSDLPAFDVDASCLPDWIDYFLRQGNFYLSLIDIAKGAATKRIQPKALFEVEIPLPNIDIQKKVIEGFIKKEGAKKEVELEIQTQKQLLTKLKQAILQEAIQGKLTEDWRLRHPISSPLGGGAKGGGGSAENLLQQIKEEKQQLIADKKIKKEKILPPINQEEIPFELPNGWVWCRLGEVYQTTSGGTPFRGNSEYWNGDIYWYKSGELNDDILSENSKEYITSKGLKESSATLFPKGTLLIAMYGATAGKLAILGNEATTNQAVCGIFENSRLSTKFIFNYMKANRNKMIKESWGMSQPNISQTYLRNFVLALPPLEEQKAIVEKVATLMQKCTALEEEIKQSETNAQMLMQAVLKEAFEG